MRKDVCLDYSIEGGISEGGGRDGHPGVAWGGSATPIILFCTEAPPQ